MFVRSRFLNVVAKNEIYSEANGKHRGAILRLRKKLKCQVSYKRIAIFLAMSLKIPIIPKVFYKSQRDCLNRQVQRRHPEGLQVFCRNDFKIIDNVT